MNELYYKKNLIGSNRSMLSNYRMMDLSQPLVIKSRNHQASSLLRLKGNLNNTINHIEGGGLNSSDLLKYSLESGRSRTDSKFDNLLDYISPTVDF